MNIKISGIIDYITYLLKKYSELQQNQQKNRFRVASIKNTTSGPKIIFQVIGKSTFMECTSAEIISNDAFIEGFSRKDIQNITSVHIKNENLENSQQPSPDLKLIQQEFNMKDGKTNFVLKDKNGKTSLKSAAEIALDKKIVTKLTQQDALHIGYIAGYEHSQNDTNE